MRAKSIILLVLALGCGLIASVGINQVLANRSKTNAPAEMVSIYVAAVDINLNDAVTPEQVRLEEWPKDKVHGDALSNLEQIQGRLAMVKIFKDEPILNSKLLPEGDQGQSAARLIPKGFRTVAIRVDDVSSAGSLVRSGDRVDLVVHIPANPAKGWANDLVRTFMQDVRVFAVNDEVVRQPNGEKIAARTINLLVTREQAQQVTLAAELGRIRLIMRGNDDESTDELAAADINDIIRGPTGDSNREAEGGNAADTNPLALTPAVEQPELPVATEEPELEEEETPNFVMTVMLGLGDVKEYEFPEGAQIGHLLEDEGDQGYHEEEEPTLEEEEADQEEGDQADEADEEYTDEDEEAFTDDEADEDE